MRSIRENKKIFWQISVLSHSSFQTLWSYIKNKQIEYAVIMSAFANSEHLQLGRQYRK